MNILDENILKDQRDLLLKWKVRYVRSVMRLAVKG